MSCRSWDASCPLFFLCPERVGVIANLSRRWMMSLFHTIIAAGVGTCWISGSVCWRKRGCVADPLKGARGLFCVLNWKLHCVFNEVKSVEFRQAWKNGMEKCHAFLRRYEFAYFEQHLSEFLMFRNKRCLPIWKWIWSFMSACTGMQKMWKDEVRRGERRVCFQECRGQSGECAPCRPPFSLISSSVTVHPLRLAGKRLGSFHFCLFRVLQLHLHLRGTLDSQC